MHLKAPQRHARKQEGLAPQLAQQREHHLLASHHKLWLLRKGLVRPVMRLKIARSLPPIKLLALPHAHQIDRFRHKLARFARNNSAGVRSAGGGCGTMYIRRGARLLH